MPLPSVALLARLSDAACDALRARFAAVGYTDDVMAATEAVAPGLLDLLRVPLVRWSLARRSDPAAVLARLFAYDDAVPLAAARDALGGEPFEALRAAGVLADDPARGPDAVASRFRIQPLLGVWIVCDDFAAGAEVAMGPGQTTLHLARMLPPALRDGVLDVGCGAGTLALLAARRGARGAVGTDINPRAIELARFNARLNGLRAQFHVGDLFEPVRGTRFDLVVAQPPYVLRPPATPEVRYLHGGAAGDEIALRVVAGLPEVLSPGGRALVLFDAAVRPGPPLHARLRDALGPARLDLLLLSAPGPGPDAHAIGYASLEAPALDARYADAAVRYRAHLEALGVTAFRRALVVVRDAGDPARRGFTAVLPVPGLAGCDAAAVDAALTALEWAALDDAALAQRAVAVPPTARWVEERTGPDPELEPARSVRFGPGALATDREITEAGSTLFALLDGAATVGEGLARYAEACAAQPSEVTGQVLAFVREGLARGLLVPREPGRAV